MKKIFVRESSRFLSQLQLYLDDKVPLESLVKLETNLSLIYNSVRPEDLRNKIFQYHKSVYETILQADLDQEHRSIDIDENELIHYAAYIGLSQNVHFNQRGGLPPFPVKEMLHYDKENVEEKIEEEEVFEF
ncbi:hypothetical protein VCUG_00747 [Vavraia culicis subsp. floridensis]|uniref:Uncharacterized protein n=1 Tax=Vavraia culicis (isolate floridensis) TaxID=948595 RepID=L2GVT1_VAVCU|nr:uncharacterized protein VCUG_00747 [Vavraia culicis subsp. floridensis]ELA47786.1 hypothetical protein VCUG_00747 [Vavraia culicis subsp. floridensis]